MSTYQHFMLLKFSAMKQVELALQNIKLVVVVGATTKFRCKNSGEILLWCH